MVADPVEQDQYRARKFCTSSGGDSRGLGTAAGFGAAGHGACIVLTVLYSGVAYLRNSLCGRCTLRRGAERRALASAAPERAPQAIAPPSKLPAGSNREILRQLTALAEQPRPGLVVAVRPRRGKTHLLQACACAGAAAAYVPLPQLESYGPPRSVTGRARWLCLDELSWAVGNPSGSARCLPFIRTARAGRQPLMAAREPPTQLPFALRISPRDARPGTAWHCRP